MQLQTFGRTISSNWLLAIHAIIPILLCVWWIDVTYFQKSLLPYMGITSTLLPLYLLIFELPHIIASLITFADPTYIKFYKKHILIGLPILLSLVGILFYLNPTLAFAVYLVATMYHVVRQQTGIASMLSRAKEVWFHIWSWSLIIASAILLILIALPNTFTWPQIKILSLAVLFLIVIGLLVGGIYAWRSKVTIGRWYVILTTLTVVCAYFFAINEYVFFAIFVVRFVHDVTAFTFYITHDTNRNFDSYKNIFYANFRKIKLPLFIVVPGASILIALLLRLGFKGTTLTFATVIFLGFTHYYVETIMWRRDSVHREQIRIQT